MFAATDGEQSTRMRSEAKPITLEAIRKRAWLSPKASDYVYTRDVVLAEGPGERGAFMGMLREKRRALPPVERAEVIEHLVFERSCREGRRA